MISNNLKKIVIVAISVIGVYSVFLSFSDLNLISDVLINFKIEFLPIIIILVTSSWLVLFMRWQILLKNSNIIIPLRGSFVVYISGFALQFIPGEVGEFLKVQLLKNKFNISRSKTTPIIITEMLYNAIGLVALSITSIWFFELTIYIFIIFSSLLFVLFYLINNKKYFFKVMNKFLKKYENFIYEGTLDTPKGEVSESWKARKQLLFKSTAFGDDIDRPLQKADGTWTYFAGDVAYHSHKLSRNFGWKN